MTTMPVAVQDSASPALPLWRMSVGQYKSMVQSGILTDADQIELLEGIIVAKMPKNPPHIAIVGLLSDTLAAMLPPGWFVNMEQPVEMSDSMPEPDCAVVRGRRFDYFNRYVVLGNIGMLVEVADSTLQYDRSTKLRLYAREGVPVFWLLSIPDRQIEVHRQPAMRDGQYVYLDVVVYGVEDAVPLVLDGREVGRLPVRELLP